jgi:hypothetical protein
MDEIIKNFDILNKLDCEKEYGNIEYKRELLNLDQDKLNKRKKQK